MIEHFDVWIKINHFSVESSEIVETCDETMIERIKGVVTGNGSLNIAKNLTLSNNWFFQTSKLSMHELKTHFSRKPLLQTCTSFMWEFDETNHARR